MEERKTIFQRLRDLYRGRFSKTISDTNYQEKAPPTNFEEIQQRFIDYQAKTLAYDLYYKNNYTNADRIPAYADFRAMDASPEIYAALNIIRNEVLTKNEHGRVIEVYSPNIETKKIIIDLFDHILNLEYNLRLWVREMIKYGDFFVYLHVDKNNGITDFLVIPPDDIFREEGYDGDPYNIRYRYQPTNKYFEEWQVAHFRILEDSRRLPYGRSVLDPIRKLWKQLQLAEDAMLVYRITRAPNRLIFYIELGNIPPEDEEQYMQLLQRKLKHSPLVDPKTGNINYRYNPHNITEDFWLPMRNGKSSKIETLQGASNMGEIQDVQYLQSKLFAGLIVPKSYLNFDSPIGGATLSQKDIRFAAYVQSIQQAVIMELRRIANIHLFFKGKEEEIDNFIITMNNPSPQLELMKLNILKEKAEVFEKYVGDATPTSPVSYTWALQNILNLSKEEIIEILKQKMIETKIFSQIESAAENLESIPIFKDIEDKYAHKEENLDQDKEKENEKDEKSKKENKKENEFNLFENLLKNYEKMLEKNTEKEKENTTEKQMIIEIENLSQKYYYKTKNMIDRIKNKLKNEPDINMD